MNSPPNLRDPRSPFPATPPLAELAGAWVGGCHSLAFFVDLQPCRQACGCQHLRDTDLFPSSGWQGQSGSVLPSGGAGHGFSLHCSVQCTATRLGARPGEPCWAPTEVDPPTVQGTQGTPPRRRAHGHAQRCSHGHVPSVGNRVGAMLCVGAPQEPACPWGVGSRKGWSPPMDSVLPQRHSHLGWGKAV